MSTKPKIKRAQIVKFRLDELAGVDEGAQAAAGSVVLKRKADADADAKPATSTTKRSALTSAVQGHTHLINGIEDMQSGCTSYDYVYDGVTNGDYRSGHAHSWVRTEDGSILLGESAGHTHEISTVAAVMKAKDDGKSSPSIEVGKVADMTTKIVALTESQFAHFKKLSEVDGEAFALKSFSDREVEVAKALDADPVVYTAENIKVSVRRSDGPIALQLAQQAEASAVELQKAKAVIEVEKSAREMVELKKRAADTIGALPGSDDVHMATLKAVESIADEAKRTAAIESLKAANAVMKSKSTAAGFGGAGDPQPTDANEAWNAEVAKFATAKGIKDVYEATEKFLGTTEGRVAKAAYDKSRGYGLPQVAH